MCCGQKRSAIQSRGNLNEVPDGRSAVNLQYQGSTTVHLRGPVSGQVYQFTPANPHQPVDRRDAVSMLQTRLFRQAK
jgi:hypothetical protein